MCTPMMCMLVVYITVCVPDIIYKDLERRERGVKSQVTKIIIILATPPKVNNAPVL